MSWRNGYADIQHVLYRHKFANIQGTVYLSERGVRQAHGTLALQEVAIRFSWFEKCVANVQFYDLADDFNAQFIIDGITQARVAFERRIAGLRQQLVGSLNSNPPKHRMAEADSPPLPITRSTMSVRNHAGYELSQSKHESMKRSDAMNGLAVNDMTREHRPWGSGGRITIPCGGADWQAAANPATLTTWAHAPSKTPSGRPGCGDCAG